MNNFPNKFQIIVIATLILALFVGLGFSWPKYQELNTLNKRIEAEKDWVEAEEEHFSSLSQLQVQLAETPEALAKITASLPDTPSLPSLFNFIQRASSQTGMVLKEISPFSQSFVEDSALKETKVTFQLMGSYPSLKSFIFAIENSARLIEIENIAFSYPKEGQTFTFNLRIKVLSY